jgi:hypothetical protein
LAAARVPECQIEFPNPNAFQGEAACNEMLQYSSEPGTRSPTPAPKNPPAEQIRSEQIELVFEVL